MKKRTYDIPFGNLVLHADVRGLNAPGGYYDNGDPRPPEYTDVDWYITCQGSDIENEWFSDNILDQMYNRIIDYDEENTSQHDDSE